MTQKREEIMEQLYVRITLRIPQELHKKMAEVAKEQDRSLNKQMVRLMQMGLDQQSRPAQVKKSGQTRT